jgi:hypothetical protein
VAIASNESFSGWTKTFTDPRLCAAIVDRLTFTGNIIETGTGTGSYRLAHAPAARNDGDTALASPPTIPGQVNDRCPMRSGGRRAAKSADAAIADVGGQR